MWQEVYLSALLRAILYADDANYVSFGLFYCAIVSVADLPLYCSASLDSASSTPSPHSRQSSVSSRQPRRPSSRVGG